MTPAAARVRERLVLRRERLAEVAALRDEARLVELLRRVDSTLASIDIGAWGDCHVCAEPISTAALVRDPLVRVCLECLSVEERRSLERDLEAAARVQHALLPPSHFTHDGWEIGYLWQPRAAVAGDHVDVAWPRTAVEPLNLVVGDVAGHGVAASLLQSHLHALFRALSLVDTPLDELMAQANRLFCQATEAASYATLVAARLHVDGRVELANAGHPRPLLADRRGVRPVERAGIPLGLLGTASFPRHELRLAAGETLLLYTDGWTEAMREGEEYGVGRGAAALRRAAAMPVPELLAACREDGDAFLAGERREDDLTLVAVRRTS